MTLQNIPNQDTMEPANLRLFESSPHTYRQRVPPKHGLLKWIGNKLRFAERIVSYFPDDFGTYIEPFLGSGAVLATLVPKSGIASDIFPALVDIWQSLKNDPDSLKTWYEDRWRLAKTGKVTAYAAIRESFNRSPNAADLLFLCRACYGGVVRFRKVDGFMSTPCGIHDPIAPARFSARVDEWSARVKNVDFRLSDYRKSMALAERGDLVYCDPPYVASQKILYGAQDFSFPALLDEIARCKKRGVRIALSIDGRKTATSHCHDLDLPAGLFEREVLLDGGPSMLKRFQSKGESLENARVADRLLLSY